MEVNNVTLDGDMLQLAARFLDMDKEDAEAAQVKDVIKKLKGILGQKLRIRRAQPIQPSGSR
ncbi:MAG: hypothetical protein DMG54_10880 [Acidobacteria bacterium]|nr:MAG: hypothetical protein DMG54_10880 [Acidobacteriota bacterium]